MRKSTRGIGTRPGTKPAPKLGHQQGWVPTPHDNENHDSHDVEESDEAESSTRSRAGHVLGHVVNHDDHKPINAGKGKFPRKNGTAADLGGDVESGGGADNGTSPETGDQKLTDDSEKAADDIKQRFIDIGMRPPTRLRRRGRPLHDAHDDGAEIEDEEDDTTDADDASDATEATDATDADVSFFEEIQMTKEDVDEDIDHAIRETRGYPDDRRSAFCIHDQEKAKAFDDALKIVANDGKVKTALAKAGRKGGVVAVRVLAATGGLVIVGMSCFVAIVSEAEVPVNIASVIASQIIKAAELVEKKTDQKFEKDALKKEDAEQLMRLMGTNLSDVEEHGTMSPQALKGFQDFKLMAATLKAQNMSKV
ncbi:hypothetical protein NW768_000970 [Fusarium equiseti]|uniref:Uncharacterized protein n=1 Tax=Fusarium equiseti TaxID=61235 RepID=A0ABQ8RUB5_FUSEQ|nr:hypothetical protein NW768_000970 [Fusarium equiseti]